MIFNKCPPHNRKFATDYHKQVARAVFAFVIKIMSSKSNCPRLFGIVKVLILLGFAVATQPGIFAQTTSASPVLRLETGLHTAPIRRIAVDRSGRWLVTASQDKTVRVWDVHTGELVRVLRVPIGLGIEGEIIAVALSPDGNTVAVSGYLKNEDANSVLIYLFDRESGHVKNLIDKLPTIVFNLEFSLDNRFLVATLSDRGVRLYETIAYRQIGIDTDYGDSSYGADFDRSGSHLVTSCDDGFLRLYAVNASGLRLISKQKAKGGTHPYGVKFSPDGKLIAVGFADTTAVNVLNAADLGFAFAPDTTDVSNGSLSKVVWSSDGSTLYAGAHTKWTVVIRFEVG